MKRRFDNKKVIITGGAGGIGSVVTAGFLHHGANVLVVEKSKIQKNKTDRLHFRKADVTNRKQVKKIGVFIKNQFDGQVDVLVNAAAIYGPIGKLEELDLDFWQKTIEVNLVGTANMCAMVIPFMKKRRRGKIINFSGGGEGAFPRFTAYSASKGAILRFTESLAQELVKDNIFVNAVAPGPVNTAFLEEVLKAGIKKVGRDFYLATKKQKKEGGVSPGHVRDLILFLAGDESGNLTGKLISAIHDNWQSIPKNLKTLEKTDIFNVRRIKPKDRDHDW